MLHAALLTHIYYPDSYQNLKKYFLNFKKQNCYLFFSISHSPQSKELAIEIKRDFPDSYIIETPNVGKDIGGKIALIDLCIRLNLNVNYYIFLHDKKSPHTTLGNEWRDKLFRIIENESIHKIKHLFENDSSIGMIAANEFISNEYNSSTQNFNCTSNEIIKRLIKEYALTLSNYDFVGGTMFWIRAGIINSFFKQNSPIAIRATLEKGNVLDHKNGSNSHSWERMLSFISTDQNYKIKGI